MAVQRAELLGLVKYFTRTETLSALVKDQPVNPVPPVKISFQINSSTRPAATRGFLQLPELRGSSHRASAAGNW